MIFHFISAFLHIDTNIQNNYNIKKCRNPQVSMFYQNLFVAEKRRLAHTQTPPLKSDYITQNIISIIFVCFI